MLLTLAASIAFAQNEEPILYECLFRESAAANISESLGIQVEISSEEVMKFSFVTKGKEDATMIGNLGGSNVVPVWGQGKLTFVEVTGNGTVQTTALYGNQRGGRVAAVHSRTTGGAGFEMPSQWYGFCQIK